MMKHIKTFEDFQQTQYAVSDIVKLKNGEVGKIVKINTPNSYIINIMKNTYFINNQKEVRIEQILGIVDPNNKPVTGPDININPRVDPSNDMVINGAIPTTPVINTLNL